MAQTARSAASHFHFTLEGMPCGFLESCDGGTIVAELHYERMELSL
jgi:hypothetical protein